MPFTPQTKFLLVDDFATMRKILRRVLSSMGFENIAEAANGQEALKALEDSLSKNDPFHIILSDWSMPVMNGLDFLKACQSHNNFKSIPFVFVTAEGGIPQIEEAKKAGLSGYITKPFTPETVKQVLDNLKEKMA